MRFLALSLALAASASAQTVDFRPVVLTGTETPILAGAAVTAPVCFTFSGTAWSQCPLQIDERALLDRGSAYPLALNPEFYGIDQTYHYTAPQDYPAPNFTPYVPVDPNPTFDADDELVLMARYFGQRANTQFNAPPHAPARIQEVAFESRYVYLYAPTAPLSQGAGVDLVSYRYTLQRGSGRFPQDYDFSSDHYARYYNQGWNVGTYPAANPENSQAQTAFYRTTFSDRWIQDQLSFTNGAGGFGPDILDRVKYASRPDYPGSKTVCGRNIWTGSSARGTLGIQKDGPLRAIRVVQGYNSGGYNNAVYLMYERYLETRMEHAMHQVPGSSMWYDLEPSAFGMTYTSNVYPNGVVVDGVPDYATGGEFPKTYVEWDYLIGTQGSMVGIWEKESNIAGLVPTSFYEDANTPAIINCTGDRKAIGNFGNVHYEHTTVNPRIPSTDPREPEAFRGPGGALHYFRLVRKAVHGGPNLARSEADALVSQLQNPIRATVGEAGAPIADTTPPILTGSVDSFTQTFVGSARDAGTGLSSVALAAGSTNLTLATDPFSIGTTGPVGFTVRRTNTALAGSGQVVAQDGAGLTSSISVQLAVSSSDVTPPVITATVNGTTVSGTITEALPSDLGLASVALDGGALNLTLQMDPVASGAQSATFVATSVNPSLPASGTLRATDLAGHVATYLIDLPAAFFDLATRLGSFAYTSGSAGTLTVWADNIGTRTLTSVAVQVIGRTDVASTSPNRVTLGTIEPGASRSATFQFTGAGPLAQVRVRSRDNVVQNAEPNTNNNTIDVRLLATPSGPTLTGTLNGSTYTGTAQDATSGLATLRLGTGATNLTLAPNPFPVGTTAPVSFVATPQNAAATAQGHVVATNVTGQADSVLVRIDPLPVADTASPVLSGTYGARSFDGTATENGTSDTGLASISLRDAVNLKINVPPFASGARTASFSTSPIDTRRAAEGTVVARDVAGNEGTLFVMTNRGLREAPPATPGAPDGGGTMLASTGSAAPSDIPATDDASQTASSEDAPFRSQKGAPHAVETASDDAAADTTGGVVASEDREDKPAPDDADEDRTQTEDRPQTSAEANRAVATASEPLPDQPFVVEAYPNPFSDSVTLRFYNAEPARIAISLYERSGRTVATLVDAPYLAGWHQIRFDGAGLSSGLYIWRATARGHSAIGRLTLLK